MNTVKDEKVWGYSKTYLSENKENNFIHSSGCEGVGWGEDSNLRKEEGKKQRGRGKSGRGLPAKCIWAGPRVCFPGRGMGVIFPGSRDGVTRGEPNLLGAEGTPTLSEAQRQVNKLKVASGWKGTRH